jgi:hypothetical protein
VSTHLSEADPVLVALAAKHPELDAVRWIVRLPDGTVEHIAGDMVASGDSRVMMFNLDDGTTRKFGLGEWLSARGTLGTVAPVLNDIIRRLHAFGLADGHDILNQGAWLQAQPEWIAYEREHATPAELADAERIHAVRKMGL